jgi:hypothetical protein
VSLSFWLTIGVLGGSVSAGRYLYTHILARDARGRSPERMGQLDCGLELRDGARTHVWVPEGKALPGTFTRLLQLRPDKVGKMELRVTLAASAGDEEVRIGIGPVPKSSGALVLVELQLQVRGDGGVSTKALDKKTGRGVPASIGWVGREGSVRFPVRSSA